MKKSNSYAYITVVVVLALVSCGQYFIRSNYKDANGLIHQMKNLKERPFLKVHLKNGDVCIMENAWKVDTIRRIVSGDGTRYDFNRNSYPKANLQISMDSVAIYETNVMLRNAESARITALTILGTVNVVGAIICLTNPKACFGSCPTFYLNEDDNFHYADAEGFSNAIAPSMEYGDVDALGHRKIAGDSFSIIMKNEALETHCVNDVRLLACPLTAGKRVYQSPSDHFYLCENLYPLQSARGEEGDITDLLKYPDRKERFSLSDENNLASKEEIYLTCQTKEDSGQPGLVLNFRQTMMTTYFIYSALGYMGDEVGDIFAMLETRKISNSKLKNGIKKELGQVEIYTWNETNNRWEYQHGFYETGPIAINRQFIPLHNIRSGSKVRIKIVLNKGLWRMDYAALTNIRQEVTPLELTPTAVLDKGKPDPAGLSAVLAPDQHLLSMPGSAYTFQFRLPQANTDYEFFLYSKGYYLEWMRDHWLKDKNLLKLKQMMDHPARYLRQEAKTYKQYEATIEREFWNSKIDTKTFSYYEN